MSEEDGRTIKCWRRIYAILITKLMDERKEYIDNTA